MLIETPRLILHKLTEKDLPQLEAILQDPVTMTAYEGPFSDAEVRDWLDRMLDPTLQVVHWRHHIRGVLIRSLDGCDTADGTPAEDGIDTASYADTLDVFERDWQRVPANNVRFVRKHQDQ